MSVATWVPVLVATIAAAASIFAAAFTGRSARITKSIELDSLAIRELEMRVSERKYEMYKPMIDMLSKMVGRRIQGEVASDSLETMGEFSTWISIYGSDGAVQAYQRYMQALFSGGPPMIILLLYGRFVLEARKDLGSPASKIAVEDLLGISIRDLYGSELAHLLDLTVDEACVEAGWMAPWLGRETLRRQ